MAEPCDLNECFLLFHWISAAKGHAINERMFEDVCFNVLDINQLSAVKVPGFRVLTSWAMMFAALAEDHVADALAIVQGAG